MRSAIGRIRSRWSCTLTHDETLVEELRFHRGVRRERRGLGDELRGLSDLRYCIPHSGTPPCVSGRVVRDCVKHSTSLGQVLMNIE
jgi:hypothetical protein